MTRELTPKQERFVLEYLLDLNAKRAAIRAGYSEQTAQPQSSRLLSNVKVQKAILAKKKEREQRTTVTTDRVVKELARIAFSNITDVASWNESGVTVIDSKTIPRSVTAAVQEVHHNKSWGTDAGSENTRVKMLSKQKALETLAQHLGMLDDRSDGAKKDPEGDRRSKSDRILDAARRVKDRGGPK